MILHTTPLVRDVVIIIQAVQIHFIWSIIIKGLKRLEYRGYDSSGISTFEDKSIVTTKCRGKISNLEEKIGDFGYFGTIFCRFSDDDIHIYIWQRSILLC